jgi:hypothetical protein
VYKTGKPDVNEILLTPPRVHAAGFGIFFRQDGFSFLYYRWNGRSGKTFFKEKRAAKSDHQQL